MALNVDIRKMTAESLYNDIHTLLTDHTYEVFHFNDIILVFLKNVRPVGSR